MASTSNVEILECFQSKVLHTIADTTWYVSKAIIQRDLQTPTVKKEICHYSSQYSVRLSVHPWLNPTTGNCEDTCQMICLPDSGCNCFICSLAFKV
jgi:hypothetical protein